MASIWEKAISILTGNLNSGRSYVITAVIFDPSPAKKWWRHLWTAPYIVDLYVELRLSLLLRLITNWFPMKERPYLFKSDFFMKKPRIRLSSVFRLRIRLKMCADYKWLKNCMCHSASKMIWQKSQILDIRLHSTVEENAVFGEGAYTMHTINMFRKCINDSRLLVAIAINFN